MVNKGLHITSGNPIAVFQLEMPLEGTRKSQKIESPNSDQNFSDKYAYWGENNNHPQLIVAAAAKNGALEQAIQLKRDAHVGGGLIVYTETVDTDGKTLDYKVIQDQKIDDFFGYSNLDNQYLSLADGHWMHFNYFPEIIMSKSGEEIAAINFRDPVTCRVGLREKGAIPKLYLSYNWDVGEPENDDLESIPAINPFMPHLDLKSRKPKGNQTFYLPTLLNTRGRAHYNACPWHGLLDRWLDIGNQIPTAVKQMIKNQMVLKFHVQINYGYWVKKYKGWDNMTDKAREAIINEELDNMNNFLRDVDNYGKSLISFYEYDSLNSKDIREDIKITTLDNKLKDLNSIMEFQKAANGELLFGIGMDGTLIGQHSPGGSEAGSGSNKREAMWVLNQLLEPHRKLTINPWWNLVRDFNKWPKEWKMGVKKMDTSQTLDKNPTKSQNTL
jgi:hypothetical protein